MASGDEFRFEGTFRKVNEAAQQAFDELTQLAAMAREGGDEVRAGLLEQQAQLARGNVGGAAGAAGQPGAAGAEALARANAERERAVQLDREDAAALAAQRDALVEQYQLRERLQRGEAPQLFVPPTGPQYGSREATAGGQVAAEAAARQRAAIEALAAGGVDEAMLGRLRAASIVTPEPRGGGAYEQLAAQQAEREAQAKREQQAAEQAILEAEREQAILEAQRTAEIRQQTRLFLEQRGDAAYQLGGAAAANFRYPKGKDMSALAAMPEGVDPQVWAAQAEQMVKSNATLGMYDELAHNSSISSEALTQNLTRLGVADAQASDQLRRHGALTTEFLGALARGETTVSEFGYQIGATIGKFGGWATAAAATYGALGAVVEIGKGAFDTASAVERLNRTIDNVNPSQANQALQALSRETNVSMAEAGDAVFQYSRTFHSVPEATAAARLGLAALKLDNVSLSDSVRASTAITQQYGGGLGTLTNVYNMLSAAQREYNARISDMIPLLQRSSGAVRNAGGDLTQLIQIGTAAVRTTQQGGSQVGTALYRSAATFLNPANAKGTADIQTLRDLGVKVDPGNITQTILDAIRASWTMTPNQRAQLSNAIFGPQYGGRMAALFNPNEQSLIEQITGRGRGAITPTGTRGSLNQELSIELRTARESLSSFIHELGRLGAAVGDAGGITLITDAVRGLVDVMSLMRGALDAFDQLPGPIKESLAALTALRLGMLFFSRTRFGSTAPGITRVPGFRPSEATLARGELAIGTRQAINQVQSDLSQTNARLLVVGAQQSELERRKALIDQGIADAMEADEAALERSVALGMRIGQLQRDQAELEDRRTAQQGALVGLNRQQVGLTAISRNKRMSDEDVLALRDATSGAAADAATTAANEAAADENTVAMGALARAKARLAGVLRRNAVAEDEAGAAMRGSAGAAGVAAGAGAVEAGSAAAETAVSTGGLLTRLGGLASALDPLTLGLVALPFAFEGIKKLIDNGSNTLPKATNAANQTADSLAEFAKKTQAIQQYARKSARDAQQAASVNASNDDPNSPYHGLGLGRAEALRAGVNVPSMHEADRQARTSRVYAANAKATNDALQSLATQAASDAKNVQDNQGSRQAWYRQLNALRAAAQITIADTTDVGELGSFNQKLNQSSARTQLGLQAYKSFNDTLQTIYRKTQQRIGADVGGAQPFAQFWQLGPAQVEKQVQLLDDYSKIFGTQGNTALRQAAYAYTYLANKFATSTNSQDLQAVASAQQNFLDTVNKTVTDLETRASTAGSLRGESADTNQAIAGIDHARKIESDALRDIIKLDAGNAEAIRHAREAAAQIATQLNQLLQTAISNQVSAMESQSEVAQSGVTGYSPESDLTRATIAVRGYAQQLQYARSKGADYATISGLQKSYNDARNTLYKDQVDQARAVIAGTGDVAASAAQGLNPADAINVARRQVDTARTLLSFDQAHGAGEQAILSDQKSLLDAEYNLNQTIQSRSQQLASDAQQLISAQAALAESKTLDPVQQAIDAINADARSLATIKPQNYATPQQYQAAVANAQAQRNKDIQAKRDAIINQDMQTLSYEYNTMQIGSQQYINGLERILRTQKMSLQQRQQIEQQIYQLKTTQGQNLDLNVGSIKLPSIYEIRRAIGLGRSGEMPGAAGTVINHQASVVVNVYSASDVAAVGNAIDQHLNTSVRSAMRAKGVVGV